MSDSPKTAEELAAQIQALVTLTDDAADGYSLAADAMWKAALLAFNYAADQVGATGFQGSWAALKFYGEVLDIKCPFGVVMADHALYPQYDEVEKVRSWIEGEWRPWIIEEARKKLAESVPGSPKVLARWRALAGES